MSVAVATLRLRLSTIPRPSTSSPLSRSAGEGLGVRAALTFPPAPFLSHAAGEEGGDDVPHLPPRRKKGEGSVAVATLRLRLSTIPRPSTSSPLSRSAGEGPGVRSTPLPQRGRGAGGEGLPQRGSGVGGEGGTERWPPTPWLPEHGTFPRRNPGV